MASTPSPSIERPSTPPAPRFGAYHDHWEPFQRRKSSRISSQQATSAVRTPSPPCASTMKTEKRTNKGSARKPDQTLLTPTKTPRRTKTMKEFSGRVLPSVDESVLSRTGRTFKKISGSTLESFVAEEQDQDFAIFSDPRNGIPQKDEGSPFYNPPPAPKRPAHLKRKTVRIPGEGSKLIDEAVHREDGMVMNFRGKTYFQPITRSAADDSNEIDELSQGDGSLSHVKAKPFKPRLLWPSKKTEDKDLIDEEEAATDIEDANLPESDDLPASPVTPVRNRTTKATPNAPKFPVSPPATQRTTRSTEKLAHPTPSRSKAGRSQQPALNYNKWGSVAKTRKTATTTGKRVADEPLGQDRPKRARSSEAQT
ncbi:uncharacterized protein F5Z01DRAFT_647096 [Emericellopsis atlantica]|uniref:Uncharacterized protein n=1 Tax=Emericellopsis atlantica TaxID=2614577 RepID=A0A9P8CUR8_9HYPO|nr:uncharacterized protein F5Z01DRAFT_647096 [Emericellopsis atlantica]KAG9257791.1 hypothetical protein F5Z01DRAFT_647096 [Emericellopsis atlantica]